MSYNLGGSKDETDGLSTEVLGTGMTALVHLERTKWWGNKSRRKSRGELANTGSSGTLPPNWTAWVLLRTDHSKNLRPTEPMDVPESEHHLRSSPCRPVSRLSRGPVETVTRGYCHRPGCSCLRHYLGLCPPTLTSRPLPRFWLPSLVELANAATTAVPP